MNVLARAAAVALLLALVAAGTVTAGEPGQLPPDSDPRATLAVVAIGALVVTGWYGVRSRRTPR